MPQRTIYTTHGEKYALTTRQNWRGVEVSMDGGMTFHPTPAAAYQRTPADNRRRLPRRPDFS